MWLLRYDFCKILNFDFRFGQEVKVKLGSLFVNIFWQLTICTMVQKFWIYLLWLLRYDFFNIKLWLPVWTGSKGQIGVTFCKYFLTINDLYNGATIVNLPLVVVEIWIFFNINLWLPVWTGSKGQIGVTFLQIFFDN